MKYEKRIGQLRAIAGNRGRIPIDDFHKSASEGEGACSRTYDGRSHLPLRGKLGWMTPRPGQKKTGKRNASFGALVPKREPLSFLGSSVCGASRFSPLLRPPSGGHLLDSQVSA